MKNRINATSIRRTAVLGSIVSVASLVFSCSPAGKDSVINPGTTTAGTTATAGGTGATGGSKATGSGGIMIGGDIPKEMPDGPCMGLACKVPKCEGQPTKTTISGKIYAPNGTLPLYNVVVYVPNAPVVPFTEGASCDRCGASITNPVTSAITDETGSFVLNDAPADVNVPLVIQVGKWRRQITIPAVAPCVDTPLTDPQMMRLPRNKTEGDIPKIAITVGAADQMECLPLRLGIDPAEFTTAAGDGRIHLFEGDHNDNRLPVTKFDDTHNAGVVLPTADTFWVAQDNLMKYDIVILSCEGDSFARQKPMNVRQAMYDYASAGGRVFASHWHNIWFSEGPQPVPTVGTWQNRADPTDMGGPLDAKINTTFPKGAALAQWLVNVGASTTLGTMTVTFPRDNLQAINPMLARDWITIENPKETPATATEYMSFNAPIGAADDKICGRAVYTDLHVASVDNNNTANALGFPASCEEPAPAPPHTFRDLSAQEKAVAFMLFDLSACVQNEDLAPKPPK
jgi:hypothetical protein